MAFMKFTIEVFDEIKDAAGTITGIFMAVKIEDDAAPVYNLPQGGTAAETKRIEYSITGREFDQLPPSNPGRANAILAIIRREVAKAHAAWINHEIPGRPQPKVSLDEAGVIAEFGAREFTSLA